MAVAAAIAFVAACGRPEPPTAAVMQQNLATSSMEALQVKGKKVLLVWDRKYNRPVQAPAGAAEGSMDQEEGQA